MIALLLKHFKEVYPSRSQIIRAGVKRIYLEKLNIDRIILDTKRQKEDTEK